MRKLFAVLVAVLITATVWAQSPEKMSYQAVIRNVSGELVANQAIGLQFSILQGSSEGAAIYIETQTSTSNSNGLISVIIGDGTIVKGNFETINWDNGPYFIKTETDLNGGSSYSIAGTSQLLSVPYALYAKTSGSSIAIQAALNSKVDKISGKDLSSNDYSTIDKNKLASIAEGAEVNVNADWNSTSGDAKILNKPTTIAGYGIIDAVVINGNQTISGNKTFTGTTTVNTPVNPSDAATKAYVDELKMMVLDLKAELGASDERDGNHYKAVRIGKQIWMAENLKYLPSVVGSSTSSATLPYYYVYGYNGTSVSSAKATTNYSTYGVLYNWAAAVGGTSGSNANPSKLKGVCPTGWHLPSSAEWLELITYLGGQSSAGGKLKETGIIHWKSPNVGANNESGFTALPGGYNYPGGFFDYMGYLGFWWSATQESTADGYYYSLNNNFSEIVISKVSKEIGYSVRCVRD